MTQSASLIKRFLSSLSLRNSSDIEIISRSVRLDKRSRTCNPVVPASPSMKIFFFSADSETLLREYEEVVAVFMWMEVEGVNALMEAAVAAARKNERDVLVIIFDKQ